MAKRVGSRMYHGAMVIPCAVLCLLAVISFGSFASEHDKIRKKTKGVYGDAENYCILFTEPGGKNSYGKDTVQLGDDGPCVFSIWGGVCVCLVSIVIGVVFLLKAVIGVPALSFFLLVELVVVVLVGLLEFAVAIVISAGLDHTCDTFVSANHNKGDTCVGAGYKVGDKTFRFYHSINTARATAWIGTIILAVLAALHFILLFAYFYQVKHRRNSVPYGHMDQDREDLVSEDKLPAAV